MIAKLLAFLLALLPVLPAAAEEAVPAHTERVATIDWGTAETLLALGVTPLGLAETAGYRDWVGALPPDIAELGLRATPSLEYLAALKPDVILSTPQFTAIEPMLGKIAPVINLATFIDDLEPYRHAQENTRRLGALTGREQAAADLIALTDARIAKLKDAIGTARTRPVLVLYFQDDRHAWVFCRGSLFDDVLKRAGLTNAWTGGRNFWGFANAGVDQLFAIRDAALLVIEPVPPAVRAKLAARDGLLGQMPAFAPGNYEILPSVWGFGGLPSAGRFADLLLRHTELFERGHAS
ncbi:iron-siderophore ABC transporter substrate-binding protein [Mesorhizobium sp. VK22B]|uniref:Iron-siderophore ABC transporter substrate-binding protein n=1 Tax=Mesorhizobium captivum TaxID=3072319 RepID=A0ABU4Z0W9_9HYPH|nr:MULTISPECIES: iron-siderophore ABC transporter substrate-binding protein [unclassified Mesorhizobium]MDX8491692.1 iron-siderophore ABC transporter substrate-binding protein [Mesorhizobium sp. VK22B]MDX8505003.1 iron-siderophore ABC transporter substrate-binding protein [Mesorhizobium sp. VK22E]